LKGVIDLLKLQRGWWGSSDNLQTGPQIPLFLIVPK